MSGGHFDYAQYRMEDIAAKIDILIDENGSKKKDEWERSDYPPKVIFRFKEAAHTIRQAQEMAQRIDWLVSGDDGEETFLSRWNDEVSRYFPLTGKM